MDDEDLAARIAEKQSGKKKKKKKKTEEENGGVSSSDVVGADGEVVRKKKKKKKKPKTTTDEDGVAIINEDGGGGEKKKKRKKKKPKDSAQIDDNNNIGESSMSAAAVGTATATTAAATATTAQEDEDAKQKSGWGDDIEEGNVEMADMTTTQAQHEKYNDNNDDINNIDAGDNMEGDAYCFEADTEIMAEINQEGLVQVDESGGIQAFVAETIAIEGDAVGVIKSDAEIEKEEKKKYTKYFCGAVVCLVVVIVAIAVPLVLKFAKGDQVTKTNYITDNPTSFPSSMPSLVPSSAPTSPRYMDIVRKLEPISGDLPRIQGTPQYFAAMWMADDDPIPNLSTGSTGLELDDPRFEQRYIMALFYYAMDGPNWVNNNGWLGEESECYWFGIDGASDGCGGEDRGGCIKRSDLVGDYDKVCRIGMGRLNNLYGEIPSELGELKEMRWFEIQDDYLVGTIPDSLGSWEKVHTMLLGGNYLEGGIPNTFSQNEMLGTIFIDRNQMNGTFPSVFSTLTNLEWLDAEDNDFEGTLPRQMGSLKSLRILNLNNNTMTGFLPDTWDEKNLIEDFEVANNNFRGTLPGSLARAKWLKDFRASNNTLTGEIPTSWYEWENLEELYLDDNSLGGELPQTPEKFYDGLQEFSVHNNNFEGRFPVEHFEPTLRIKVLSLYNNDLTGTITTNICDRRDASLAWTQLTTLTADCDKIKCSCCTCWIDGVPQEL